jgi:hypothetical protein
MALNANTGGKIYCHHAVVSSIANEHQPEQVPRIADT